MAADWEECGSRKSRKLVSGEQTSIPAAREQDLRLEARVSPKVARLRPHRPPKSIFSAGRPDIEPSRQQTYDDVAVETSADALIVSDFDVVGASKTKEQPPKSRQFSKRTNMVMSEIKERPTSWSGHRAGEECGPRED